MLVFPGKEWQGCKRDPVLEVSTDRWTGGRINPGGRGGLVAAGASAWWWAVSYLSSSPFFSSQDIEAVRGWGRTVGAIARRLGTVAAAPAHCGYWLWRFVVGVVFLARDGLGEKLAVVKLLRC